MDRYSSSSSNNSSKNAMYIPLHHAEATSASASASVPQPLSVSLSPMSSCGHGRSITFPKQRRSPPGRAKSFPKCVVRGGQNNYTHLTTTGTTGYLSDEERRRRCNYDFEHVMNGQRGGLCFDHELTKNKNNKGSMYNYYQWSVVAFCIMAFALVATTTVSSSSFSYRSSFMSIPNTLFTTRTHHHINNIINNKNKKQQSKTSTHTVGADDILGFSSLSMVTVQDERGSIPISELQVGDKVMGGNGNYQQVYSMGDSNPTDVVHYIHIHTKPKRESITTTTTTTSNRNVKNDDDTIIIHALDVTSSQMVYLYGAKRPIQAQYVEVGDLLANGDGSAMEVSQVYKMPRYGRYTPITNGGTIVVNGFVATSNGIQIQGKEGLRPALPK